MPTNKQKSPLVSVVIPTYNSEKYIESAVNSVQTQSLKNIEIIVINDGSTDNTEKIVNRLKLSDPRLSLYSQKNSGRPAIARNAGCAIAKGNYIAFMDSDDIMLPGKLEAQVNALEKIPDAVLIFHDWSYISDDGKVTEEAHLKKIGFIQKASKYITKQNKDLYSTNTSYYNFASTQILGILTIAVMMKRDTLLEEKEWFPEDMDIGEDLDLWFRVLFRHKALFINKVYSQYRSNPNSITKNNERMFIGLINVQAKNLARGKNQLAIKEKRIIKQQLASRYRSLAYHHYTNKKNVRLAKIYYIKSFSLQPSIRHLLSVIRVFASTSTKT